MLPDPLPIPWQEDWPRAARRRASVDGECQPQSWISPSVVEFLDQLLIHRTRLRCIKAGVVPIGSFHFSLPTRDEAVWFRLGTTSTFRRFALSASGCQGS